MAAFQRGIGLAEAADVEPADRERPEPSRVPSPTWPAAPAAFPDRARLEEQAGDSAVRARGDLPPGATADGRDPLDAPLEDGTPAAHPGRARATHAPAPQGAHDLASGHDRTTRDRTTRHDGSAPAG